VPFSKKTMSLLGLLNILYVTVGTPPNSIDWCGAQSPTALFPLSILPPGWLDRGRGSLAFISILVSALVTFWGPLEEVTTEV
jgi:hypothetical protein